MPTVTRPVAVATSWVEALHLEAMRVKLWVDWEVKTKAQFTIFR
jgi:hypothetical protein